METNPRKSIGNSGYNSIPPNSTPSHISPASRNVSRKSSRQDVPGEQNNSSNEESTIKCNMFSYFKTFTTSEPLVEEDDLPCGVDADWKTMSSDVTSFPKGMVAGVREPRRKRHSSQAARQREIKATQSINIRFQQKKQQFMTYPVFDMSNLPHVVNLRRLMLILCMMCVCIAPCVYLPMGSMQKITHQQNCFLNATIYILEDDNSTSGEIVAMKSARYPQEQEEEEEEDYGFDPLKTVWGDVFWCHYTTFSAVSISIFSTIVGWTTLQVWPELMSVGQGGVLALLYLFLTAAAVSIWAIATYHLAWGLRTTCENLHLVTEAGNVRIDCTNITHEFKYIDTENNKETNHWSLDYSMRLVLIACWMLTGLLSFEILVSVVMFGVIWWYYHLLPTVLSSMSNLPSVSNLPTMQNSHQDQSSF